MSSSPDLDALIDGLRSLGEPSSLYPLAAGLRRAGEATARGHLILVAATVTVLAIEVDGLPLGEREWDIIRQIAADLANLLSGGLTEIGAARVGASWRSRAAPSLPN